jgi:hypothetical protein
MNEAKSTQTESVLVCSLPAPDLAARRVEINKFFKGAKSVTGTPDGILFVFANTRDIAHALTDFILFEQKCCGTILYELRSSPPHTQLTLQLYAPQKQVNALRAIYLEEDPESGRPGSPAEVAPRFSARLDKICEAAGPFGALACAIICLGMPVVSAALGLAGAGFLRNDRLLIPGELLCCAMLLWSLLKSRRSHGKSVAAWLGTCAIGAFLGSMFLSGMESKASVGFGLFILVASLLLNRHFHRVRAGVKGCSQQGPNNTSKAVVEL